MSKKKNIPRGTLSKSSPKKRVGGTAFAPITSTQGQLIDIGRQFKSRRIIDLKMEVKALQMESGVSSMTFVKLENGELENISLATLNKIAGALGMEIILTAILKK